MIPWVRRFIVAMMAVLDALALSGPVLAEDAPPLWPLAEMVCRAGAFEESFAGGFLAMMGLRDHHAMRYFKRGDPTRFVMVPAEGCPDRQAPGAPISVIFWHILRPGEGRYYLASVRGKLVMAIDGIAARKANYMLADPGDLDVLSDYEAERAFWAKELGLPAP